MFINVINLDFIRIKVMSLKVYLYKLLFTFPIGERNIPIDIFKNIDFPVPNNLYLTEKLS